jgi:hypothetical protein
MFARSGHHLTLPQSGDGGGDEERQRRRAAKAGVWKIETGREIKQAARRQQTGGAAAHGIAGVKTAALWCGGAAGAAAWRAAS